jgi:protein TonB
VKPAAAALAAIACAFGSSAWAQATGASPTAPAEAASASIRIVPEWRRATGDDVARVYPSSARRRGVQGIAMIACRVTAEGEMADCQVEQEAPEGEGFGEAALKLMPRFRMRPQTADGAPVAGGLVRLPIQFRRSQ